MTNPADPPGRVNARRPAIPLDILLIEDDPDMADLEETMLAAMGHFVIARATNMHQAMHAAGATRPDVALVDIGLADGDNGLEVARRLFDEHGIRSIFVSGNLFHEDGIDAFRGTGALAFVAKPFRGTGIEAALAAAIAYLHPVVR